MLVATADDLYCDLAHGFPAPSLRLEAQMTSDIQAILQLLQRQITAGPPAYSTVTSSPPLQVASSTARTWTLCFILRPLTDS